MKILIIGGAGYIGSHVAREFLDRGDTVTVFDDLSTGLRENLFPEASFIHGSIHDYGALLSAFRSLSTGGGDTAVVYLAAYKAAGESMVKPEKYSKNILAAINILNAMAEGGIKYLIYSSSAAVYGVPQYVPIDEEHPVRPLNFYGFTKVKTEELMDWYDQLKGIRYASLRYFNAAGYDSQGRIKGLEQNPANLIPIVMEVAAGIRKELEIYGDDYDTPDGTCIRDYIHVSDLARSHSGALDYLVREDQSLKVNLGSGQGVSVEEILTAARRITGRPIPAVKAPRRPGDPASLSASSALAERLLGWRAQESDLDTLISSTWNMYRGLAI
ncbi:MAG: UDP-glucose 4-epimerase GalE [Treponema sp.]|nr:UDP-glucose 4-epimerase GalE [Treponema sp.]